MSSLSFSVRITAWLGLMMLLIFGQGQAYVQAGNEAAGTAPVQADDLPACEWGYYPGGSGSFTPLIDDADAVTPSMLRLGSMFRGGAGSPAGKGSLDFNADGITDVFRFKLRPDNYYQWQYSPGGISDWVDLAYDSAELNQLLFGDFNGDGTSDIFTSTYDSAAKFYRWNVSYNGAYTYTQVNTSPDGSFFYKVGDFDGDGKADIFDAKETSFDSGEYQWRYSSGATAAFANLAYSTVYPYDLRLGDFDGDGKSDVFAAVEQSDGSYQWVYSSAGSGSYQNLALTSHSTADLNFGDFDGDGKTDVFALTSLPGGDADWSYWPGGQAPPVSLQTGPASMPLIGEFDGDGKADAFLTQCSNDPRFTRLPKTKLSNLAPGEFYTPFVVDVNGDGLRDLLWSSKCQGSRCATGHNKVAVSLSNGRGGFASAPVQVLDTSQDWSGFRVHAGEVNGDDSADLLFIELGFPQVRIFTGVWNGSGYSLSGEIPLGALPGYNTSPGDFNGDGLTDFVLNTVCLAGDGLVGFGCSLGNDNNAYIAMNNGGTFSLGPLQSLGTGWGSYYGFIGDVNGDGLDDIIWNSTCQDSTFPSGDCDVSAANYVYVGLSNGNGGLNLSPLQVYGDTGWKNYRTFTGDFNGDERTDLAWYQGCPANAHCNLSENQLRIGLANSDGTFQVSGVQTFGLSDWSSWNYNRADVDGDGNDDLIWIKNASNGPALTREVRVALSNGNGTFTLQPTEDFSNSFRTYLDGGQLYVGDVTGDDKAELAWYGNRQLDLLLNGEVSLPELDFMVVLPLVKR